MPADVGAFAKLIMKHGPKAVEWTNAVADFIRKNPELPAWAGKQLEDLAKQAKRLSKRRDDAEKIRKVLERVGDGARNLQTHAGEQPGFEAAPWLKRAENIELRVRLAAAEPKSEQKKTLAQLNAEALALLADLSVATASAGSAIAAAPADEPTAD